MSNEMQIWIDRHRVGISEKEAQLRQIPDLIFRNHYPTRRSSNLISRQPVVRLRIHVRSAEIMEVVPVR